MSTILITGGSGLIGTALTKALLAQGHAVRHLGRSKRSAGAVQTYVWDIHAGTMDHSALEGVDHIIHLAGAGIADKRWTEARVKELIASRAASAELLLKAARSSGDLPRSFISAAGINYYGALTSAQVFTELDPPGTDTIARISVEWERAVDAWSAHGRVVKLRTPVVLSATGGALAKLTLPVRMGLGSPLGSGTQWMPWVHIDDLVRAYQQALANDDMRGAYNVCAADQVTNAMFMRTLSEVIHRPYFLPAVPAFVLRLALGELSSILLEGSRASDLRLRTTGFHYTHDTLRGALEDLL